MEGPPKSKMEKSFYAKHRPAVRFPLEGFFQRQAA
jgi:hypothetical protein